MFLADVHIYENHRGPVAEQLIRSPRPLPSLRVSIETDIQYLMIWLETVDPSAITLVGYDPHPPIKAQMAV